MIRQLLAESVVLSVLGTGLGIALASWGIDALILFRPEGVPRLQDISLNGTVLAVTTLVSAGAALLFGVATGLIAFRSNPALLRGASNPTHTSLSGQLRRAFVVGEVSLSVVLLLGAGLLTRSFLSLSRVETGFDASNVVTATVSLPFFGYQERQDRIEFFDRLVRDVGTMGGVESVGATVSLPLAGGISAGSVPFAMDAMDPTEPSKNRVDFHPIVPGFLETIRASVRSGRLLTLEDNDPGPLLSVVVDQPFATLLWPNENPVGAQFHIIVPDEAQGTARQLQVEVVGVIDEIKHRGLAEQERGAIYLPYRAFAWFEMSLAVRTAGDPMMAVEGVRAAVGLLDGELPVFKVRRVSEYVADAAAPERFALVIMALFAGTALLLSVVGLYGVLTFIVRQRTQEIGVRIALGAARHRIATLVVRQGLLLTTIGIVFGIVAAAGATRVLEAMLYNVSPTDPWTFFGTAVGVITVAAVASYIPARRATRVDPLTAIRSE